MQCSKLARNDRLESLSVSFCLLYSLLLLRSCVGYRQVVDGNKLRVANLNLDALASIVDWWQGLSSYMYILKEKGRCSCASPVEFCSSIAFSFCLGNYVDVHTHFDIQRFPSKKKERILGMYPRPFSSPRKQIWCSQGVQISHLNTSSEVHVNDHFSTWLAESEVWTTFGSSQAAATSHDVKDYF